MSGIRQRKWQKKQRELGRCCACNSLSLFRSDRCFRHHTLRLFANAGLRAVAPKELRRREVMLTFLVGRYTAVCITGEALDAKTEAPLIWEQLGFRSRRSYRNSPHKYGRAEEAFTRVVGSLDRKAFRHANAEEAPSDGS